MIALSTSTVAGVATRLCDIVDRATTKRKGKEMYYGQRTKIIIAYDEYGCPVYEDEDGQIIYTSPSESEFIAADNEDQT